MTETLRRSTTIATVRPTSPVDISNEYVHGWRIAPLLGTLIIINAFSQIDRILPFILAEVIKTDLALSDTQMGLLTGVAFAVCYALLSLPPHRRLSLGGAAPRQPFLASSTTTAAALFAPAGWMSILLLGARHAVLLLHDAVGLRRRWRAP